MNDQASRYPLVIGTNCKVEENWLHDFFDDFSYEVLVNNDVVFEWSTIAPQISADRLKKEGEIRTEAYRVRMESGMLYIDVSTDIHLKTLRT